MDKATIRELYKKRRQAIGKAALTDWNNGLLHVLQELSWPAAGYIHVFLPILRQNEPDTWHFIDFLQREYPSVKVVISRTNPSNYTMEHFLMHDGIVLQENNWGIVEPVDGERISETAVDVVLIPLLVADCKGNRVGYGKGFYDRFLAQCRPDCVKIGVSYFDPIDKIDDVGSYDIPLDMLVTPKRAYRFSTLLNL